MRLLALILVLVSLGGCITEGTPPPEPPEKDTSGPGPVDRAQARVGKLIERLDHVSGRRLLATLQEIMAFKQLAQDPVVTALPDATPRTQANLIYVLGFIGDDGVHPTIATFLKSREPSVRFEAAAALLNRGDWGGVPTLLSFMESQDRRDRYKASQAMKEIVKKDFGYQFDAPVTQREQSMKQWREWWKTQSRLLIYGKKANVAN